MTRRSSTPPALVLAFLTVGACSSDADKPDYVERPVSAIYNEAMDTLNEGLYADAAVKFAYYLKGLSYYEQISDIARDQRMTRRALATFRELINRYPTSRYASDAKIKLDLTNDHLAGKDMEIGRDYLRQGHNLAAINRFKAVIDGYQTTTHVPEALHRLTEAYLSLGIIEEARKTAAVLGHTFPLSATALTRRWWWPSSKSQGIIRRAASSSNKVLAATRRYYFCAGFLALTGGRALISTTSQ